MAVGEHASTNPFDEPSEDEEISNGANSPPTTNGTGPTRATITNTTTLPFVKLVILLACTILVCVLLIAGTATTALSYPPKKIVTCEGQETVTLDGDYKLLGPLLLTSGCFLFCVDAVLWYVMIRESYNYSKIMPKPGANAWNRSNSIRPLPISLVGGPFFIATADPAMAHPPFLPVEFPRPNWVHPNAPLEPQTPDLGDEPFRKGTTIRPETATLSRSHQPPYNPEHRASLRGP